MFYRTLFTWLHITKQRPGCRLHTFRIGLARTVTLRVARKLSSYAEAGTQKYLTFRRFYSNLYYSRLGCVRQGKSCPRVPFNAGKILISAGFAPESAYPREFTLWDSEATSNWGQAFKEVIIPGSYSLFIKGYPAYLFLSM
jgi:hypothetical protein